MAEAKEPDKGPYRVLSGYCPDQACQAKLFFPAYDLSIECTACGQRHSRNSLRDVEEVTNPDIALHNIIRKILHSSTKKGSDSVKVLGLSNYQCKLVSPLLTRYGMNKQGQAQLLQDMGRGETFDCTILSDRTFLLEPEHMEVNGYGRDRTGSMVYLGDTLAVIKKFNDDEERLLPIHADGDGHCLVHALSRALIGRELFWHALRQNLKEHFISRLDTYKSLFCDFIDVDEWRDIIAECDPNFNPVDGEPLGLRNIHIFGLANVLRRPIILLDSLLGMQSSGDYTGVFLPRLLEPDQCRSKDGHLNRPLCLAWSSSGRNHYIALVPVKGRKLPRLPKWMLPKAWGVPQDCVHSYMELDDQAVCTIGSNNCLPDKYVLRLVQAMEKVFMDQFGVSPSLVADVHQYVYKSTGVVGVKPDIVLGETQRRIHEKRLYRCLGCNAISIFTISHDGLQPDGALYQLAEKIHGKLNPMKTYAFPLHGLVCRYDAELDKLVPEEARCELKHCKFCQGQDLRLVSGDGTVQYKNGDCTNTQGTQHPSCKCQCGYKHYWNGCLYDNLPRELPVKLEWAEKTVSEVVTWFQYESDPTLNSNVFEEAQQLVQKHFPGTFGSERLVQKVVDSILRQTAVKDDEAASTPVLDDSDWNPYSSSKIIMSGRQTQSIHKEELNKCETERKLAHQIEQKAGQEQSRKKAERMNRPPPTTTVSTVSTKLAKIGSPPTPSTSAEHIAPASPSKTQPSTSDTKVTPSGGQKAPSGGGQKKVRVSTSDGRQSTLTMEQSVTYAGLQAQLDDVFSVPPARQRIKHGFPPRELQAPSTEHADEPLPISHGDRITLEILPDLAADAPTPSVDLEAGTVASPMFGSMQSSLSEESTELLKTLADIQSTPNESLDPQIASLNLLASLTGRDLWTYVQTMPQVFSHGGVFYEQVKRDLGLTDGKHCTLPWLPGKTFRYNQSTDMLELCLEPHGHFPITVGVEQRVLGHPVPPVNVTPHSSREEPPDLSKILGSGSSGVMVNPQMKFPKTKPKAFTGVGHTLASSPAPSTSVEAAARSSPAATVSTTSTGDATKSEVSMEIDKVKESSEKAASQTDFQRIGPGYTVLSAQQSNEANVTSEMFQNIAKTIQAAMMETEADEGVDVMATVDAVSNVHDSLDTEGSTRQTLDAIITSIAESDSHNDSSIPVPSPSQTLQTCTTDTIDTPSSSSLSDDHAIAPAETVDSEAQVPHSSDSDPMTVSITENQESKAMSDTETMEDKPCDHDQTTMEVEHQNEVEVKVPDEEKMDMSEAVNGLETAEVSATDVHIELSENHHTESKPPHADAPNGLIQS